MGLLAIAAGCAAPDGQQAVKTEPTAKTAQAFTQTIPFDWDSGNIAIEAIIPAAGPLILTKVTGGDATIILHIIALSTQSWFDAVAPYSRTAVGFYSSIPRRPASEAATNRNMNIAILYANYRTLMLNMPEYASNWRALISGLGLDPDDNSTDLTTPVGIGNTAGNAIVAARVHDGMNVLGDEGGKKYNLHPYDDTTGYQPVNTATVLSDPSRWQPRVGTKDNGIFTVQKFVTPQYGHTVPLLVRNVDHYTVPPPVKSDWQHHPDLYRAQAADVLAVSAGLTDEQKIEAELFNNKILSLGVVSAFAALSRGLTLEQYVQYDHMVLAAAFDGGIAAWRLKDRFDAVRPFSAIHFLYGDEPVTAWGGKGRGTVTDLRGRDWESYIPTPDHPEYPSGTTCLCEAHAEASRRYFGSDALNWSVPAARGSSVIEPGVTPANDIVLQYPTWTDLANRCGFARVLGGVHFRSAVEVARPMCQKVGAKAYKTVMRHVNGDASVHAEDDLDD